jgi:hypothetical protein
MTMKVEWRLREVTRYELVRSYSDEATRQGGIDTCGTYDTEEQGRHALRLFKDADGAERANDDWRLSKKD